MDRIRSLSLRVLHQTFYPVKTNDVREFTLKLIGKSTEKREHVPFNKVIVSLFD